MQKTYLLQVDWFSKRYLVLIKEVLTPILKKAFLMKNNILLKVNKMILLSILNFLKKHALCLYKQLLDIAVEDTPKKRNRFRVNYILSSILYNAKIIVSLTANELTYLPSVTFIYSSACWLEREVWDLFGVYFRGNPDMRRILTDYGFSGHPLRKDFPLTGFFEIYYSLEKKRIITEPVELAQEYRVFSL